MAKIIRPKICFALVTNREKSRYEYIRPMLNRLKRKLSDSFDIEIFECWGQPKVVPHSLSIVLRKRFGNWVRSREWARYREMKPRIIFLDLLVLIWRLALAIVNRKFEGRRNTIYSYITDKHIRAWMHFLETEAHFLICFEDDVILKQDSVSRLEKLLNKIESFSKKPIYIDLAGGCDLGELMVENLESKRDGDYIYFKKPVTNTACCYIINRTTAEIFLFNLLKDPGLRRVSCDLLFNKLFVITSARKYFCCHANPTIFSHGSTTGKYPTLT